MTDKVEGHQVKKGWNVVFKLGKGAVGHSIRVWSEPPGDWGWPNDELIIKNISAPVLSIPFSYSIRKAGIRVFAQVMRGDLYDLCQSIVDKLSERVTFAIPINGTIFEGDATYRKRVQTVVFTIWRSTGEYRSIDVGVDLIRDSVETVAHVIRWPR